MIEYFQEDGQGAILIANGIDPMLRWDGLSATFEPVGMDPPATAVVVGGSGAGPIVGEYFAFERFVDALGNVSNLSPISASYTAQGATGTITAATNASPIVITSAGHTLSTGATVKITGVGGNTSANGTFVVTVINANTFSLNDSHGTADYNGGGTWISGITSLSFSSVPLSTESKVVRRQILRNTDGQATTFYVDVDSTDLLATTFSSTRSDTDLATQEAVPLLDTENNLFANRHDKPLSYFPFLAANLDRMFACGSVDYSRGSIKVTNGSVTVVGVGTEWKSSMSGRFLYVTGATESYEIASINETAQTLTLTTAYTSPSDKFAFYAIKPPPAYRRLVVFTEAGLPQSWSAVNGIAVQETGDEFTGLCTQGNFTYIMERRHFHKLTFSVGPLTDGGIFQAAARGSINGRCWITVDDALFSMDELGAYMFSDRQIQPISGNIQSFFQPPVVQVNPELKINWSRREFFFASLDKQLETIRWFLCISGDRYPRHALCYHYREQKWWLEGFPFPICGSCVGEMGAVPQVFLGGANSKILAMWQNNLDITNADLGTVRGKATSATLFTLTDSAASFPATTMLNAPIAIVRGKGKGQTRKIIGVAGKTISLDLPWNVIPDETSTYQIGGVHWQYKTGLMRYAEAETDAPRTLELAWGPVNEEAVADLRFTIDNELDVQAINQESKDGGGIASVKGETDLVIDLTFAPGIVRKTLPGHREHHIRGRRYVQFELEGHSNNEPIVFYQWIFEGLDETSAAPSQN